MSEIWKRKNPKKHHHTMTKRERARAGHLARRHGRKRPGLVDNINASRGKG